ncbi:S-adenosyl-l-methionine hydroxide adenosyltransferase family protein [Methanolobus mangrovi]|uniref:S-adenosyl-l-methionine hydroxide adenosyltransferase family protein n=1 Tax=Methanolobus mangrovi TaxID=3072977 RepID=A0AA51UH00_9EURY|nr:S-adenosyl-l-methionine hydroxide adenosyltransferase family protein [Methanolobus mangrovi]WMW21536.1 S-adenosyl-l-methionine hydroxide adenosyltransferase family protein [Methanolobus mangrovi]
MAVITLTTDFGSLYPASMKGVMLGIDPDVTIVDITHSIPPMDIRAGAFALYSAVTYFPPGTIHVAVIDPGVGTERKAIVVRSGEHYFIGPDNGVLIPAASLLGDIEVFEIKNQDILGDVSSTFQGRDIFAPVAAHISRGMDLEDIGNSTDEYIDLDFSGYVIEKDFIEAKVIYVDKFGNIVTNIPQEQIVKDVLKGTVLSIAGRQMPFLRTYGEVPKGRMLSLIGSHGFFEIAVNQGSASKLLHLNNGNEIRIGIMSSQ